MRLGTGNVLYVVIVSLKLVKFACQKSCTQARKAENEVEKECAVADTEYNMVVGIM